MKHWFSTNTFVVIVNIFFYIFCFSKDGNILKDSSLVLLRTLHNIVGLVIKTKIIQCTQVLDNSLFITVHVKLTVYV